MLTSNSLQILCQNPYQNARQVGPTEGFSNNLPYYGDIEGDVVTAEVFNAKMGTSREMAQRISVPLLEEEDEPLFGAHIREAATTLGKLFGKR